MEILEAITKFIKRADRIDVSALSYSHTISVADNKLDITFLGTKTSQSKYNKREDGIVELGNGKSEKTAIEDGEVYVEFKGVEIFKSDNNEVVAGLVDLVQNRYESLKKEYRSNFIDLVIDETTPTVTEGLSTL